MTKYYLTKDASVVVESEGKTFTFAAADYFQPTSSWWGTYKTDDETEIAVLDQLSTRGISEISEDDYEIYELKKKKAVVSVSLINLPSKSPPQVTASSGKPAVVVEEPAQKSSSAVSVESFAEAIEARPLAPRKKAK